MSPTTSPTDSSLHSAFHVQPYKDQLGHLYFWTRETWSGDIPVEQQKLRLEFDEVCSVLRARFQERKPQIFQQEFNRLLDLAHATFSGEYAYVLHGLQSLEAYKAEIVRREGPEIKDEYLKELAKSALIASILILLVSFSIRAGIYFAEKYQFIVTESSFKEGFATQNKVEYEDGKTFLQQKAKESKVLLSSAKWNSEYSPVHFGFLLASTMWGIWLSFAVRNMNLSFEQLQNPESDLMRPWSRLLAFGLLAFILALFFQMQVLVISVGGVSTSQISEDILIAIFVGLCLGFTDKALPGRVQQRIEEFFQNTKSGN